MDGIIEKVREKLREAADEKTLATARNFFKEEITAYGVKGAAVHKIAKECYAEIKHLPKAEILALCEELWRSGYMEEGGVACDWSFFLGRQYDAEDLAVMERWIENYVGNWAACDTLCNHTVGELLIMRYPQLVGELKRWARSGNRWMKRAAAVSLIIPARKGLFRTEIFEIADMLLLDPDDMIQKGYGWMLKAAADFRQGDVFDYVMSKKSTMPRTALRYAIEKMPRDLKARAMAK